MSQPNKLAKSHIAPTTLIRCLSLTYLSIVFFNQNLLSHVCLLDHHFLSTTIREADHQVSQLGYIIFLTVLVMATIGLFEMMKYIYIYIQILRKINWLPFILQIVSQMVTVASYLFLHSSDMHNNWIKKQSEDIKSLAQINIINSLGQSQVLSSNIACLWRQCE